MSNEVISGHALAARWKVRPPLLREIVRQMLPGLADKGPRERYYLGPGEQRALREVFLLIDDRIEEIVGVDVSQRVLQIAPARLAANPSCAG